MLFHLEITLSGIQSKDLSIRRIGVEPKLSTSPEMELIGDIITAALGLYALDRIFQSAIEFAMLIIVKY
jgi:hypothetical protein